MASSGQYDIAIIGAGPAGLSAAAHAAACDRDAGASTPSYVLLEGFSNAAKTIYKYQRGKHVMAEPGFLELRADVPFAAGTRESILEAWDERIDADKINIQYGSPVHVIEGEEGAFSIALVSGDRVEAKHVVLAIGTQGNPRALGIPGDEESSFVHYTLDDPEDFKNERIVVIGAGDAAIENAIALAKYNHVVIVNRRSEFSRAKEGNLNGILAAINDPTVSLECRYEANVTALDVAHVDGEQGSITLSLPDSEETLECHRVLARLGTIPPKAFLERCRIQLDPESPEAVPEVDRQYQSIDVPGLYIIGALIGSPLIKQAMNQGYDVVEFIQGRTPRPADYPLINARVSGLPYVLDAEDLLDLYRQRVPMFSRMSALSFRELIIESRIIMSTRAGEPVPPLPNGASLDVMTEGEAIYRQGEFGTSFYTLVEGSVRMQLEADGEWHTLQPGQFFGEISLISGRPRQGDAVIERDTILIETPRRIMLKLLSSNSDVAQGIDRIFVLRALQAAFSPKLPLDRLMALSEQVETRKLKAGETLFKAGEDGDSAYLVRIGNIALNREGGRQILSQHYAGELVGQMAVMGSPNRKDDAVAVVRSEVIEIPQAIFLELAKSSRETVVRLQQGLKRTLVGSTQLAARPEAGRAIGFLMQEGYGEATNALVIDDALCVGCDNCERACADTHDGISRLDRAAGPSKAGLHIPTNCRHCEIPHCMKDCPPDAIRRAVNGEVFITDACIGCGNCETNCPYDAISLRYPAPEKPSLLSWLFFGRGPGPGDQQSKSATDPSHSKKAVKCDACMNLPGGPACVRACPTGAALRINRNDFVDLVEAD